MMWLQGHHIDFDQRITPVASDTSTTHQEPTVTAVA